jgi:hypothetical protein
MHSIAQVELFRSFFDRAKEALQAAAQICGLADIRLGVGVFSAQKEN